MLITRVVRVHEYDLIVALGAELGRPPLLVRSSPASSHLLLLWRVPFCCC